MVCWEGNSSDGCELNVKQDGVVNIVGKEQLYPSSLSPLALLNALHVRSGFLIRRVFVVSPTHIVLSFTRYFGLNMAFSTVFIVCSIIGSFS